MCLGIPARVVGAGAAAELVHVEMAGTIRVVNAGLLEPPPGVGDWVLVHLGFALSTMTETEAREALADLEVMALERIGTDEDGPPW